LIDDDVQPVFGLHPEPPVAAAGYGRHRKPSPRISEIVARHWMRFTSFSAIGGGVFALGLALQIIFVRYLHLVPDVSYLGQGIISIQVSFLANYFWTWRDVDSAFWPCGLRFNVQKILVTVPNLALYAALTWIGMNYLLANIVVTGIFTVINYVLGDRWVFTPSRRQA
jgi:putative flippase GtrA